MSEKNKQQKTSVNIEIIEEGKKTTFNIDGESNDASINCSLVLELKEDDIFFDPKERFVEVLRKILI